MKQETRIDYYERMQRVVRYIDEHLGEPLRLREISQVACFSEYHFHRIFLATLGTTVQDYISSRRLGRAMSLLMNTSMRVTDVALEAGYESMSAFTQVFRKYLSLSPSQFRKLSHISKDGIRLPGVINPLESFKKQYAQRRLKPESLPYEKRELPDLTLLAIPARGFKDGLFVTSANEAFARIIKYVERHGLEDRIGFRLSMLPYVPLSFNEPDAILYCGFSVKGDVPVLGEAEIVRIKGGTYAVFRHDGPYEHLVFAWNAAYVACMFSGYEVMRNEPPFEIYLNSPRNTLPQDLKTEIHIPVV